MSRLRVALGYFHAWPNDAGFHVASAEGLYADAGLEVEIAIADPLRGDALAHLVRGEVDFAVCPPNRLLVRREHGEPVVGVAAINHAQLETIQTLRRTGIERPRDLAGRRLAYNPTPRGRAMVRHLVALDGGDPDAVVTVDSGVRELGPDEIATGEIDATFGSYWAWEVLFPTRHDAERVVWPVADIGAPRYHSYVLAAREEALADPDRVAAFLGATADGFGAAAGTRGRTLAVLERVMAWFPRDVLARSLERVAPTWHHEGRWGVQRPDLFEPYARWLAAHGVLRSAGVTDGATTNDLLPR